MNSQKIYHTLKYGTAAERQLLLQNLPKNSMSDSAIALLGGSQNPTIVLMAYGMLLPRYVHGGDTAIGASLGDALFNYGKELFESEEHPSLFLSNMISNVGNAATAKMSLGRFTEVVEQITGVLDWAQRKAIAKVDPMIGDEYEGPLLDLNLKRVEALIQLNRIDEADGFLRGFPEKIHFAYNMELQRLRGIVGNIKGTVTEDAASNPAKTTQDAMRENAALGMEMLEGLMKNKETDSAMLVQLKKMLGQFGSINPETQSGYQALNRIITEGERTLTGGKMNSDGELTMTSKVREANSIFVGKDPTESEIKQSLETIQEVYYWAQKTGNNSLLHDALYTRYLCYSRLKDASKAADQLWNLWQSLEHRRKAIRNLHERGKAFAIYPHLFPALCQQLAIAGRTEDLFEAIEGGKGRVLSDLALVYANTDDLSVSGKVLDKDFLRLLQRQQCHYISFFVDVESTYAVLVSKTGRCFQHTIPLGEKQLNEFLSFRLQEPKNWNELEWMTGQDGNMTRLLSPLIEWLYPLYEQGIIEESDHLVYSPDHHLHLFPLQFVRLGDRCLLEYNSVSSIHSAASLKSIFSRDEMLPSNLLGIFVPSTTDAANDTSNGNLGYFNQLENYMDTLPLTIRKAVGKAGSVQQLLEAGPNGLIHFCTHGYFPEQTPPYTHSGLLLAANGDLPQIDGTSGDDYYANEHLLSPKVLFEAHEAGALNLNQSSLFLQACVSGHSKEGIGGDALGLEWSFFYLGATTVISASWNVDIVYATMFAQRFYDYWLKGKMPKRVAHQQACLDLIKEESLPDDYPRAYYWAAFRLSGDWR